MENAVKHCREKTSSKSCLAKNDIEANSFSN